METLIMTHALVVLYGLMVCVETSWFLMGANVSAFPRMTFTKLTFSHLLFNIF